MNLCGLTNFILRTAKRAGRTVRIVAAIGATLIVFLILDSADLVDSLETIAVRRAESLAARRPLTRGRDALETCRTTPPDSSHLVVDDLGVMCDVADVNPNGCCGVPRAVKCGDATGVFPCHEIYSHCVACCASPAVGALRLSERRAAKAPDEKSLYDAAGGGAIAFCAARCRTHARDTLHENRYVTVAHHCFVKHGHPPLPWQ